MKINLVEWIKRFESLFGIFVQDFPPRAWGNFSPTQTETQPRTLLTVNINCLQSITQGSLMPFDSEPSIQCVICLFLGSLRICLLFSLAPNKWWYKLNPIYEPKPIYDIKHINSLDKERMRRRKKRDFHFWWTFLLRGQQKKDKSRWPIINDVGHENRVRRMVYQSNMGTSTILGIIYTNTINRRNR